MRKGRGVSEVVDMAGDASRWRLRRWALSCWVRRTLCVSGDDMRVNGRMG